MVDVTSFVSAACRSTDVEGLMSLFRCKHAGSRYSVPMQALFEHYLYPAVTFVRREAVEPVKTVDIAVIQSFCKLLGTFFEPLREKEGREPPKQVSSVPLRGQS
jgi:hypothetical protein